MAHPFPSVTDQPLRTLTESGIGHFRKLNDRDEKELELLRAERARLVKEIDSVDDVMTDLHETIGRRQAKMRGDHIAQLTLSDPLTSRQSPQGDSTTHLAWFSGQDVIEPTSVKGPGSFEETKPDGFCVHCNEPVWKVSITPASPKGFRHSYGATCNPDDPSSGVAELDERAIES
jgi:hypothetical protein